MDLHLYNTMSRELQAVTSQGGQVRMYCCGPTVYRDAHVGNMRTFVLSDLIRRTLLLLGKKVSIIQNITDVGHLSEDFEEDKVVAQSRLENSNPFEIARKYEEHFHADLLRLNVIPADKYPRASDSIPLMLDLVDQLIALENAYVGSDETVYFDASSFPTYGQLSGNRLDSLKPGHRYQYSDEGGKRFHADWALWKSAGHRTEMIWDSPWGPGFPGWHIECSAMSMNLLGKHIDVHVGGIDLRFPHHENERAQSNSIIGDECVKLWVHGEHLLFQGRKMSKSAGNVVLLKDIAERGFDPLSVRLVFLENRYRSQMDLTWDSISAAHETLRRWRTLVSQSPGSTAVPSEEILQLLCNDLDTPRVIQFIRTLERNQNIDIDTKVGWFLYADQVLGLALDREEIRAALAPDVKLLLDQRAIARKKKKWDESDRLRELLEENGLTIMDTPDGQEWKWS